MPARRFNEGDIDFEAIDAELAKLAAPKLSLKDVLDRLRDRLLEQRAKGVTVAQMHEVLKARGIQIRRAQLDSVSWTRGSCREGRRRQASRKRRCRNRTEIRSEGIGGGFIAARSARKAGAWSALPEDGDAPFVERRAVAAIRYD